MKNHKFLSLLCALIMCMTLAPQIALATFSENNSSENYTIDTPYIYPVVPGTDEWNALDSQDEKVAVCQIPADILSKLTTEALVETVLDYPLMCNISAYNSFLSGYEAVKAQFNGLQELSTRSDAEEVLSNLTSRSTFSAMGISEQVYSKVIAAAISGDLVGEVSPRAWDGIIYTANGSEIPVTYNSTYASWGVSEEYVKSEQVRHEKAYPNATCLRPQNPAYNCHSYAWYSQRTTNTAWMYDPSANILDGSYVSGSAVSGNNVLYGTAGRYPEHSGIVATNSTSGSIRVDSKWGMLGLFNHKVNDCPYSSAPSYWRATF